MPILSIVIPTYNESATLVRLLEKVQSVELGWGFAKEVIIIDDGSTDDTLNIIQKYLSENSSFFVTYYRHPRNLGKGAAIRTAMQFVKGDYILIQDADLEYDPSDYNTLLQPVVDAQADVVYGSRFVGSKPHRVLFFWHFIGNKFLTFLSNLLSDLNLTDIETGYKLFRVDILKNLSLKEKRFGFEPEVTAKIAKIPGIRIYEVGISYYGRTYAEGKKINWKDGFRAIYCILKYNLF
ncbi:MAG: glycosyltransferase family 2 protein [Cytophagales bacterium]|nr:glycosyltransferase family 2 protein [Cytophagales bacterium]MDW8383799.1 glycosyltransferase family 2 protein [Flammeovirgaceae bacterium]